MAGRLDGICERLGQTPLTAADRRSSISDTRVANPLPLSLHSFLPCHSISLSTVYRSLSPISDSERKRIREPGEGRERAHGLSVRRSSPAQWVPSPTISICQPVLAACLYLTSIEPRTRRAQSSPVIHLHSFVSRLFIGPLAPRERHSSSTDLETRLILIE